MNAEVKAVWLQALRSGEYEQGFHQLHSNQGLCCLGVLCDLAHKVGVVERVYDHEKQTYKYGAQGFLACLPNEVIAWADLVYSDPYIGINNDNARLSSLNDQGMSFAEIADYIDEQL